MINRAAVILKYREPAVRWINEADPYHDDPGITLSHVNEDSTVYLISDADADNEDALDKWIKRNYRELFEAELNEWYTDSSLWPAKRTLKLFREWFEIECHTVLLDTVGGDIYDDEA